MAPQDCYCDFGSKGSTIYTHFFALCCVWKLECFLVCCAQLLMELSLSPTSHRVPSTIPTLNFAKLSSTKATTSQPLFLGFSKHFNSIGLNHHSYRCCSNAVPKRPQRPSSIRVCLFSLKVLILIPLIVFYRKKNWWVLQNSSWWIEIW